MPPYMAAQEPLSTRLRAGIYIEVSQKVLSSPSTTKQDLSVAGFGLVRAIQEVNVENLLDAPGKRENGIRRDHAVIEFFPLNVIIPSKSQEAHCEDNILAVARGTGPT
jgi:hypothetical protein